MTLYATIKDLMGNETTIEASGLEDASKQLAEIGYEGRYVQLCHDNGEVHGWVRAGMYHT